MRFLLASLIALSIGCSDHDDEHQHTRVTPAECAAIVESCHPVDKGIGVIHECHETAESTWTAAECVSNRARCLAVCVAPSDSGGDSTSDTAPDTGADTKTTDATSEGG